MCLFDDCPDWEREAYKWDPQQYPCTRVHAFSLPLCEDDEDYQDDAERWTWEWDED
jgi:hypothetical protein